jgi:hypothetical protein
MLKVSDGKWNTQTVLRVLSTQGETLSLIGRQIKGRTSNATAIVENVGKFYVGADEVSEITINKKSLVGTFAVSETIEGTESDQSDYYILATITGVPGTKTINNDGNLYTTNDLITISGGGQQASMQISDVGSGKITEIVVDNGGSGYEIGDTLSFNNTGTFGSNASGVVTVVNGAVSNEDTDHIVLEEETSAGDHLTGDKIVFESGTGIGDITDIYLTNGGDGYKSLPTVTVTSDSGTASEILAYGDNVGRILGITTSNLGIKYENSPSPSLAFINNLFCTTVTGTFTNGDTVTGGNSSATGLVSGWDSSRNILKLKEVSGTFQANETITSVSASAVLKNIDVASISLDVTAVVDTDGKFLNEKGHISETTMKVQDSLYYQDFSYVLKVGNSINSWRDAFKKTMHTSGFYFTGQVNLESRLDLKNRIAQAVNTGVDGTPIKQMLSLLFSSMFGRKLGTIDDSSSLRSNPQQDVSSYGTNTRAVTLRREPIGVKLNLRLRRKVGTGILPDLNSINISQGFAYCGPSFGSINKYANTAYGVTGNRSGGINGTTGITFAVLNDLKITGTRSSLDGTPALLKTITNNAGGGPNEDDFARMLKTNFTFPADITFPGEESFSGTTNKFDSTNEKFDQTNV